MPASKRELTTLEIEGMAEGLSKHSHFVETLKDDEKFKNVTEEEKQS